MAEHASRVEKKLTKLRASSLTKHPVSWVSRSSGIWFALAAVLTSAITIVALGRFISGTAVGKRRVLFASVGYAIGSGGFFTLVGFTLSDAIRAL